MQARHFNRHKLIDARQELRSHICQLRLPAGVSDGDGQDSLIEAQCPRSLGYGRPAGKRPGKHWGFVRRGALLGVENDFF